MKIQNIRYSYLSAFASTKSFSKDSSTEKLRDSSFPSHYAQSPFFKKNEKPLQLLTSFLEEERFFREFLRKKGKVTQEELEDIIKKHPGTIIKAQKFLERTLETNITPKEIAKAAYWLKKFYDEYYKDGCTIVSVGTSPAPITEVMSALGSKVVFLPASDLKKIPHYKEIYGSDYIEKTNLRYMLEYANLQGINPQNTDEIILLDYSNTGESLENLAKVLTEQKMCKKEKLKTNSILDYLKLFMLPEGTNGLLSEKEYNNIESDMYDSRFESISNIPHFYVSDKDNNGYGHWVLAKNKPMSQLFKEFDEYSLPLARAFSLCCLHEATNLSL